MQFFAFYSLGYHISPDSTMELEPESQKNARSFHQLFDRLLRWICLLSNHVSLVYLRSRPFSVLPSGSANQSLPLHSPPFCKGIRNSTKSNTLLLKPVVFCCAMDGWVEKNTFLYQPEILSPLQYLFTEHFLVAFGVVFKTLCICGIMRVNKSFEQISFLLLAS